MRRILYILLVLLSISCVAEQLPIVEHQGYEDGYQDIHFGHESFEPIQIDTRATLPESAENRILNLYVFIFRNDGSLVYKNFFSSENRVLSEAEITDHSHKWFVDERDPSLLVSDPSNAKAGYTHGVVRVKSPNVTNGRIYLIANIDDALFGVNASTLNYVSTEDELNNTVCIFNKPGVTRMGNFLMTAYTSLTINGSNVEYAVSDVGDFGPCQGALHPQGNLLLRRLDTKIEFRVGIVPGAVTTRTELIDNVPTEVTQVIESFEPESWQVFRLPKGCYLTPHTEDASDELKNGYFDAPSLAFEGNELVNCLDANNNPSQRIDNIFNFYTLENRQSANLVQTVGGDYHLRDKRNKNSDGTYASGDMWRYAPLNGTYVKITGNVQMQYNDNVVASQTLHSLTSYYIHLGDIKSSLDNYDVLRNNHYIYTINIWGVDKIQVEVEKDKERGYNIASWDNEDESGASGEVFVSQEAIKIFDAHFGQRVYRFNIDGILRQSNGNINNLTWYVSTPFGRRGSPLKVGAEQTDVPNGLDYQWVSFMINSKEASYIEPKGSVDGTELEVTNPQYPNYCRYNRIWPVGGKSSDQVMNVIEFCAYLRNQARNYKYNLDNGLSELDAGYREHAFDSEGNIYVTTFVDEYYYDVDPISNERRTSLWHEFVNKPMRTMHILCDASQSIDGDSALIKSGVSIRQVSLQTIYNAAYSTEGWATETMDEMDMDISWFHKTTEQRSDNRNLSIESGVNNESLHNGLFNTGHLWKVISGNANAVNAVAPAKKWAERLDYVKLNDSPIGFMRDEEFSATMRYACMMRNRDENGDGIIDLDEIKWYMASTGQLQHLYLGELGLSGAARLYNIEDRGRGKSGNPSNNYDLWRLHVVSSTAASNKPQFIWAEEGISVSAYGRDTEWKQPGPYSMRCVRNLDADSRYGKDIRDPQSYPQQVVEAVQNVDGTYTFTFERMNDMSKRDKVSGELLAMDEKSAMSMLSEGFVTGGVGNDGNTINSPTSYYKEMQDALNRGDTYCPDGYRVPNIREMTVAFLYVPTSDTNFWGGHNYMVCNYYSLGDPTVGGKDYDLREKAVSQSRTWFVTRSGTTTNITVNPAIKTGRIRCVKDL